MKTYTRLLIIILSIVLSVAAAYAEPHTITLWRGNQPAALSLTFDDGYPSQYTFVIPAIEERGFKGTFFILTDFSDYLDAWDWWKTAAEKGHDIGSHTKTHPFLTSLPLSEAEYELTASKALIDSKIPGQKTVILAYPYGESNPQVKELVQKYYIAARGTGENLNDGTTDTYNEAAYDVIRYSVAQMEDLTNQAVSQKKWLIPCFHSFDPGEYGGWSPEQFLAYMDYLKGRKDLWIAPFGTVFRYMKERETAALSVAAQTGDTISLNLTDTLDDDVYDSSLTLRSEIPAGWIKVNVQQGSNVATLSSIVEEGTNVVYYDAVPDRGVITLSNGTNQAPLAMNDSYSTNQNTALNIAAPGVLGNDTDPEGTTLTAQRVSGPSHGALTLNSNGSFTYTPTTNYTGSDSFTYMASDGALTSNIATVGITVVAVNQAPVAANDNYSTNQNTALNIAAPGALGNDTDPEGATLTAQLASGPSHGTLTLGSNGSFTYTPTTNYTGSDSFTYKASDGALISTTATVSISTVTSSTILFTDNFTQTPAPPDPQSPWTGLLGTWVISNGALQGIGSTSEYYGYAYVAPVPLWSDYILEGRIQFPSGAFGGGLGGRVDPSTGAHYGAWVYPDSSVGGSNVLKLVKFRDWTTWNGIPMKQVSLPSVGTGWHNLKMIFNGSRIQVYYDGALKIDITDNNFDSRAAYLNGGTSIDLATPPDYTGAYGMVVDDVAVSSITTAPVNQAPVAANDSYSTNQNTALNIAAPGVLSNDTDPEGAVLTAQKVSDPSHGTLTFNSNGSFFYTPTTGYSGSDSFTYSASDGALTSGTATVNITIASSADFYDDFTSTTAPPDPQSLWTGLLGTWAVNNGSLNGLGSTSEYYGYAYAAPTPLWSNYSVEARIQFPSGSYGGGIGGRVNPSTGAHYGLWVYPDASPDGSNILRFIKFHDWKNWSGIPLGEVNLPSVGTGWHTLKMVFNGSFIQIYYDDILMMEGSDNNIEGRPAYLNGGISVDLVTIPGYANSYGMAVDDVVVTFISN